MTDPRLHELKRRLAEINDLEHVSQLLSWDQETMMPPAGAHARAEQRATIDRTAHELLIAPELGRLLEELRPLGEGLPYESDEASLIRVARRDHEKARRVPPELRAELTRASSLGLAAWLDARARNDYGVLRPHLEQQLELKRRYIACFEPEGDPYDVLLDDYEHGMTTAEVEAVFDELKRELVPLIAAVREADPADDGFLYGTFPIEPQERFSLDLLERLGFDRDSWRIDATEHPFAAAPSSTDIRLTTHFHHDHLGGVFACLHEFGHGLYERQVDPALVRTPLGTGVSSMLHESQSRMWENLVGRGRAFWTHFYPQLQAALPEQLSAVSLEAFYRGINKVQPSLIRVDADEVTYNLHIILRFELEREILAGRLELSDLARAFDERMHEYLGVEVPDDVHGVLQDMHWSDATFGYFPTYALGNVASVQIWERTLADLTDLPAQLERGETGELREWLREHLHRHGRKFTPKEAMVKVAGTPLDPAPYLRYLRDKVAEVAGVGA